MIINNPIAGYHSQAANDSPLGPNGETHYFCGDYQQAITSQTKTDSHTTGCNNNFSKLVEKILLIERRRYLNGEITKQSFGMIKSRLCAQISPYFDKHRLEEIKSQDIILFITFLQQQCLKAITIKQYLGLLKKILALALEEGKVDKVPHFPKLKTESIPRGSFSLSEYLTIYKAARKLECNIDNLIKTNHRNTAKGAFMHKQSVPMEMKWLIRFMVNSFIRPVDIKLIKHKHIEVINGQNIYLRLNLPESKRHRGQVVTMRAAKGVYDAIKKNSIARGYGTPDDYLFLPEVKDRNGAIQLISTHFRKILEYAKIRKGQYGQFRTFYSLRHTAITFRLLYGDGIDLLTLARNARTSVEMIEKFYSSNLTPEMNIKMLQSKRTKI